MIEGHVHGAGARAYRGDAGVAAQVARSRGRADAWSRLAIASVVFGVTVRLVAGLAPGFPLNDGGLFLTIVEAIRSGGMHLPTTVEYSGRIIPFAYPPLAFVLAALTSQALHVTPIGAMAGIACAASALTVVAFYPLARRLTGGPQVAAIATAVFALLPRAFDWEIMGGGLTRSLGLLFAVLALSQLYDAYTHRTVRARVLAALFAGAVALTHLEMAWFTAYSALLLGAVLCWKRPRVLAVETLVVGTAVLAVTAPWWGWVVATHGPAPLLAAAGTGGWTFASPLALLTLQSDVPFIDVFGALALLGVAWCVRERDFHLPLWVAGIFLLDPRAGATMATIPIALLAAVALTSVVIPAIQQGSRDGTASRWGARVGVGTGAALFAYGALSLLASMAVTRTPIWSPASALPTTDRAAMGWVKLHTPPDARFVVVSDAMSWSADRVSEWFPTLADRPSLGTVQGSEWLPVSFSSAKLQWKELQACGRATDRCLANWAARYGKPFDYVYVSSRAEPSGTSLARLADCCAALRQSLASSDNYRLVHEDGRVQVFERVAAP